MQSEEWEKLLAQSVEEVRGTRAADVQRYYKAVQTLVNRAEALLWHLDKERNERKRQEDLARIIARDSE